MSSALSNRSGLRRAFYRILGLSAQDTGHSEHDSSTLETVDYFIMHGLWAAQYYIVTNTDWHRWISTKSVDTTSGSASTEATGVLLGTDDTPQGKYVVLEDDFLRLNGDDKRSGLFDGDNQPWGVMIDPRESHQFTGSFFFIEGDRLRFTEGANIPSDLYYEYIARHPEITQDSTAIDFPTEMRPMIVAEAAAMAVAESWLPFSDRDTERRILQNQERWRQLATSKARRTRRPRQLRADHNPYGSNWM